jgi:hypothetical protein
MAVLNDVRFTSLSSGRPLTGTGSAADVRDRRGVFSTVFCTGGSAVVTLQGSIDNVNYVGQTTITAVDGVWNSMVNLNYFPYVRAHYSGYAGVTASVFIAVGPV